MGIPAWMKTGGSDDAPAAAPPPPQPVRAKVVAAPLPPMQEQAPQEQAPQDEAPQEEAPQQEAPQEEYAAPAAEPAYAPAASASEDVLAMFARVDEQLAQILAIQQEHEHRLLELANRPAAADGEHVAPPTLAEFADREQHLHTMRLRLWEVTSQLREWAVDSVEAHGLRQQLDEARREIQDLVRQAEETHRDLYGKIQALEKTQRMVRSYQARLEALDQEAADAQGAAGSEADIEPST